MEMEMEVAVGEVDEADEVRSGDGMRLSCMKLKWRVRVRVRVQ